MKFYITSGPVVLRVKWAITKVFLGEVVKHGDASVVILYLKRYPFTLHWSKCAIFSAYCTESSAYSGVKGLLSTELLLFGEVKTFAAILSTAIEKRRIRFINRIKDNLKYSLPLIRHF